MPQYQPDPEVLEFANEIPEIIEDLRRTISEANASGRPGVARFLTEYIGMLEDFRRRALNPFAPTFSDN